MIRDAPRTTGTAPTQLSGPQATRTTGSSNPLDGHTAIQGERGPSLLSRIKNFFNSIKSFFVDAFDKLKALSGSKASLGEASEPRRQNALRSPGPTVETPTDDPVRTRRRSDSSPLPTPTPPDDPRSVGSLDVRDVPSQTVKAAATVALREAGPEALSSGRGPPRLDGGKLMSFVGKHFVATASPSFWATDQARSHVATFGSALAMSVLDRVKTAGQLTAQDRADFRRALELVPRDPDDVPLLDIPDDQLGRLSPDEFDELLNAMLDQFLDVYVCPTSTHPLPGDEDFRDVLDILTGGGEASGARKIDLMRDQLAGALDRQEIPPDSMQKALQAMIQPPGDLPRVPEGNGSDVPHVGLPHSEEVDESPGPRLDGPHGDNGPVGSIASHEVPSHIVKATRTVALRDPVLASLSTDGIATGPQARKLVSFMGARFNATASPSFWATQQAKDNVATFGGALAFSVIDRIKSNGQMTEQDRTDFRRALTLLPRADDAPPLADIPDDLLGRLDEDGVEELMGLLADMMLSVYGGPDSPHPLPGGEDTAGMLKDAFEGTEVSGNDKLNILSDIFIEAVSRQPPAPDALKGALEAMT